MRDTYPYLTAVYILSCPMSAVDRVFNQMKGKHQEVPDFPPDCIARFLCTKSSWRGKYRRIICITPTSVVTQYPDSLAITNTWNLTGDSDIDGITVSPSDAEEPEFAISARTDRRVCTGLRMHSALRLQCAPEFRCRSA